MLPVSLTSSRARTPGTPNSPERAHPRVVGLDGVRALAVTLVIVFHLFPGVLPGGFLGVDIFFVVSGFIITRLLLIERTRTGSIHLGNFWVRRARRLVPAIAVMLLTISSVAWFVGGDVLVGLGAQLLTAVTFSSNWYFIAAGSDYFAHTNPELFRNLWSLAVEEQFYLLWPLIVMFVLVRMSRGIRVAFLAALSAASIMAMALLMSPAEPTAVYYNTATHAFGLTLGALIAVLAQWWSTRELEWPRATRTALGWLGVAGIAGLLALAVIMDGATEFPYRGGLALVAVLSCLVVLACLVPGSMLGRSLDAPPLRWVGQRSYGLYLWHWPVFVLMDAALPAWGTTPAGAWALGATAVTLTVAAAAASFLFIETPLRTAGFRRTVRGWAASWRRSRRAALASATALVLVVAGGVGTAAALVSQPDATSVEDRIQAGQDALAPATPAPAPPAEVAPSTEITGAEITAIGDSVMLAAVPELQERFPGIHIDAAVSRQMSAAPPIIQSLLDAGTLRRVVVVALGTNGSVGTDTLDEVRALIGPKRVLVVVNAQAPRGWIPTVNERLATFAWQYRNVELADWYTAIQPHLAELARDRIHFGHIGATIFTESVAQALDRLEQLPPLRDTRADESLPRAV